VTVGWCDAWEKRLKELVRLIQSVPLGRGGVGLAVLKSCAQPVCQERILDRNGWARPRSLSVVLTPSEKVLYHPSKQTTGDTYEA